MENLDNNTVNSGGATEAVEEVSQEPTASVGTEGLFRSKENLLKEKKELQRQLQQRDKDFNDLLGGMSPEEVKLMRERLQNDEATKMFVQGKHDEWLDRKTAHIRNQYNKERSAWSEERSNLLKENDALQTAHRNNIIDATLRDAALKHQVIPEAIEHVIEIYRGSLGIDEAGEVFVKDKDGSAALGSATEKMTPHEFMASVKEKDKYYFTQPRGAGHFGSSGTSSGAPKDMDEFMAWKAKQRRKFN